MDIEQILAELRTEYQQINEAILNLERLNRGSGRRRGRPPLNDPAAAARRRRRPAKKKKPK